MQSLLLPPATAASTPEKTPGDQINETAAIANTVCASYVCERCGEPCDARTFTTAICPSCQWRVLKKIASVKKDEGGGGVFGTD